MSSKWPEWNSPDGSIRLINADCLDVLPTLESGAVNTIVTSPPYNQMSIIPEKATGTWGKSTGGEGFVRFWNEAGYEDDKPEPEYQLEQNKIFQEASRVAADNGSLFYNHQVRWRDGVILHPILWFRPEGWTLREEIIWDRGGGMMSNAKMFCRFEERILWFDKGSHKWNQPATGYGTIWRIARVQQQQGKIHPVQFPEDLPRRCLEATTEPGDTVMDLYMGSGTTGLECIRLGRKFIGIEKDPKHFAGARKRLQAELNRAPLFDLPVPTQTSLLHP